MKTWLKHVRGATALLDLRGEEQLDSGIGRALFIQTRTHIIAGCYQTKSPIPDVLTKLTQKSRNRSANLLDDLTLIVFQFCNVRAVSPFHPLKTQSEATTRAIIAGYTSIGQALTNWEDGLPSSFLSLTLPVSRASSDVLSEQYEVYEDIWTAGIINNYRANSILVHEALISQLSFLRDRYYHNLNEVLDLEDGISQSRRRILSLIESICASVPYLLHTSCAVAGIGLLVPLYVSAQISPQDAPMSHVTRGWMIGRLEKIGREMGVTQATMLAGLLRQQVEVTDLLKGE